MGCLRRRQLADHIDHDPEFGLRYEYTSPLYDLDNTNSNLIFQGGVPEVFIGGEQGYPKGLLYSNKHNFAPRIGIAKNLPGAGLVFRAAYGIFFTPVDKNTWCNQRHNVPYVFPETQQADKFTPPAFHERHEFRYAGARKRQLKPTTVSFTAFDPNAPAQYVQQWNTQLEKSFGGNTTLAVGYLGARGFHLQRAHLINNAPPGPGPIGPRRPFPTLHLWMAQCFTPSSDPDAIIQSQTFPVSTINRLEDTAQSWYDAGYVNLRRRYSHGLSLLANYTFSKTLTNAPDFRSPMDEAAIPQNNSDLAAEKGPGCDVRHRFALSSVFDIPAYAASAWTRMMTEHWHFTTLYQAQSGMPLTISVFGDTANAGTVLGENPIRANVPASPSSVQERAQPAGGLTRQPSRRRPPTPLAMLDGTRSMALRCRLSTSRWRALLAHREGQFQFRGEAFNALNKVNLGTPNRFVNTPQFGTITMAMTPGREIQLSARLSF